MTDQKTASEKVRQMVREAWAQACHAEEELGICVGRVVVQISPELAGAAAQEGFDLTMPGWDAVVEVK